MISKQKDSNKRIITVMYALSGPDFSKHLKFDFVVVC